MQKYTNIYCSICTVIFLFLTSEEFPEIFKVLVNTYLQIFSKYINAFMSLSYLSAETF